MELDEELLLSVAGGLGRMEEMEDGSFAYVASDDCLRAPPPCMPPPALSNAGISARLSPEPRHAHRSCLCAPSGS